MLYLTYCLCSLENGDFLALDMGGSRFKVLRVKVRQQVGKKGGVEMEEQTYPIPKELLNGKGSEVRDGIRLRVENPKVYTFNSHTNM